MWEHRQRRGSAFTARYAITRLVYYEATPNIGAAIAREKRIKGWLRAKKLLLIASVNPGFEDLSEGWFEPTRRDSSPLRGSE